MIAILAALLGGALFYLSQGLDDCWYAAWVAAAPLLWLAYGRTPTWQVVAASAFAATGATVYAIQCYGLMAAPLIVFAAGSFPIAVAFSRRVHRRGNPWITLLAYPLCWTSIEFLVGLLSPHGSFGSFAYSQVSAPVLIQSASLLGLYAVTFLICLFSNAVALALCAGRRAIGPVALAMGLCAANCVFGLVRLARPQAEAVRVAAIADESTTEHAWSARTLPEARAVAETLARSVRRAAEEGATFIVTPEGGVVCRSAWRSAVLEPFAEVSRETGAQVIVGVVESKPAANVAYSLRPEGTPQAYTKRHPVPVLEDEFTPGHDSGWLGGGKAMEICKDMDFPTTIRRDAALGVRLAAVPSGDFHLDGWIHARMAVMRGVENGFAIVRTAHNGLLTATDAQGRIVARRPADPSGPTIVVADLPLGRGPTLYTRIGDAFGWVCLVGLAGLVLAAQKLSKERVD